MWRSTSGNHPASFVCTDYSETKDWQQGEGSFSLTFPDVGPHIVRYAGCCWGTVKRADNSTHTPPWNVETRVQLGTRSDTGRPNSSPITASSPIYRIQNNCDAVIRIPFEDPDGDKVKCRYASVYGECVGACDPLPYSTLDEDTCTIAYNTSHGVLQPGWYAVSIVLEDYPTGGTQHRVKRQNPWRDWDTGSGTTTTALNTDGTTWWWRTTEQSTTQATTTRTTVAPTTAPTTESTTVSGTTQVRGWWTTDRGTDDPVVQWTNQPVFAVSEGTPMSRIPLQFLVYVPSANAQCQEQPQLVGSSPQDNECIAVADGQTYKTSIEAVAFTSGTGPDLDLTLWTWTWTGPEFSVPVPTPYQDTLSFAKSLRGSYRLPTTLLEVTSPDAMPQTLTPDGVIDVTNRTEWMIIFDTEVQRPSSPRFIRFYNSSHSQINVINTRTSSDVSINKRTLTFWTPPYTFDTGDYYIIMDQGAVVGLHGCAREGPSFPGISDKNDGGSGRLSISGEEGFPFFGTVYRNFWRQSFQLVIATDGIHSFAIFKYGDIVWTTGTASGGNRIDGLGGIPAQVGFNHEDGINYYSVPGSRTYQIVDIDDMSNIGRRGTFIFRVDLATIIPAVSGATCTAWGDPHYTTFDGLVHHFQGSCDYMLAEHCGNTTDFRVEVTNEPCGSSSRVSCTRAVYLDVKGYRISILQGKTVLVNEVYYTLPFNLNDTVWGSYSGMFVLLKTKKSVKVFYDGYHYAKVFVPGTYRNQMCGLCGNFDGNQANDFMTSYGWVTEDINTFGLGWATSWSSCTDGGDDDGLATLPPPGVCDSVLQQIVAGPTMCGMLTERSGVFSVCENVIDLGMFYDSCVFDVCANSGDTEQLCENLESAAHACRWAGFTGLSWRRHDLCPPEKPSELTFVAANETSIEVSWSPSPFTDGYRAIATALDGSLQSTILVVGTSFVVISELDSGTMYNISVHSYRGTRQSNGAANGQFPTAVDAPTGLHVVKVTYDTISISWTLPRATLVRYRVSDAPVSGSSRDLYPPPGPDDTSAIVIGLLPGVQYGITVVAIGLYGESAEATITASTESGRGSLTCDTSYMRVVFKREVLVDVDVDTMRLRDSSCRADVNSTHVTLTAPLNGCGTAAQVGTDTSKISFTNEVVSGAPVTDGVIIRNFELRWPFRCDYVRQDIVGVGPILFPIPVTVNNMLHFGVAVASDVSGVVMFVENCKATPTSNHDDAKQYYIIRNGCEEDDTLEELETSDPISRQYAIRAFRFINETMVYLHCDVMVCLEDDPDSRCSRGCEAPPARRRREVSAGMQQRAAVVQGPIVLSPEETTPAPPVSRAYQFSIRLQARQFTEDLEDKQSTAFKTLATEVTQTIGELFLQTDMSAVFLGIVILGFRSGSVVVDMRLNMRGLAEETGQGQMTAAFRDAVLSQNGTHLALDKDAVEMTDFDECSSAENHDCPTEALCVNTVGSFTCQCREGYRDQSASPDGNTGRVCISTGDEFPGMWVAVGGGTLAFCIVVVMTTRLCVLKRRKQGRKTKERDDMEAYENAA
ncbi:TECTA [Branchiostoma lanceolatum]|uniref:TECTA protein n=1 Tax=Branchiostoma lanceolatum TaxID=7740 RepID=A0A8K0A2I7_BRALA|nr:TECTA [Branchiostoma lanceolatum]